MRARFTLYSLGPESGSVGSFPLGKGTQQPLTCVDMASQDPNRKSTTEPGPVEELDVLQPRIKRELLEVLPEVGGHLEI